MEGEAGRGEERRKDTGTMGSCPRNQSGCWACAEEQEAGKEKVKDAEDTKGKQRAALGPRESHLQQPSISPCLCVTSVKWSH